MTRFDRCAAPRREASARPALEPLEERLTPTFTLIPNGTELTIRVRQTLIPGRAGLDVLSESVRILDTGAASGNNIQVDDNVTVRDRLTGLIRPLRFNGQSQTPVGHFTRIVIDNGLRGSLGAVRYEQQIGLGVGTSREVVHFGERLAGGTPLNTGRAFEVFLAGQARGSSMLVDAVGGNGADRITVNKTGNVANKATLGIGISGLLGSDALSVNIDGQSAADSLIWVNLLGNDYNMADDTRDWVNNVNLRYAGELDGRILFHLEGGGNTGNWDWVDVVLDLAAGSTGHVGDDRDDTSVVIGGNGGGGNDLGLRVNGAGRAGVSYHGLRIVGTSGSLDQFHVTDELFQRPGVYDLGGRDGSDPLFRNP
ncbi:MAG: hypothetical protein ACRC33_12255 [Gemmataceae bacterium]